MPFMGHAARKERDDGLPAGLVGNFSANHGGIDQMDGAFGVYVKKWHATCRETGSPPGAGN